VTLLLIILAAITGAVVGVIYSDALLALYDDMRDLIDRLRRIVACKTIASAKRIARNRLDSLI